MSEDQDVGHRWLDEELYGHAPVLPKISDERLIERLETITPLVQVGTALRELGAPPAHEDIVPYKNQSMIWNAPTGPRRGFRARLALTVNHGCGYHVLFKPSVAEVLAFVPETLPDSLNAFYLKHDLIGIYKSGGGHQSIAVFGVITDDYVTDAVINAVSAGLAKREFASTVRMQMLRATDPSSERDSHYGVRMDGDLVEHFDMTYPEVARIADTLATDLEQSFSPEEIGGAGSPNAIIALARAKALHPQRALAGSP